MAIDLGNTPTGTPPTAGEKLQIRSAIGVGTTDSPTFLAQTLTSQGLANAPSLAIGTGAGFYQPTNTQISVSSNGAEACRFGGIGIRLATNELGFGTAFFNLSDTILTRDGAPGILAQRNGVNAQAFRVYDTYTDASNYRRLALIGSGAEMRILAQGAGASGAASLNLGSGTSPNWQITTGGNLVAYGDNTYDIGASGANRPRDIYAGSNVRAPMIVASAAVLSQDYVQAVRYIINSGNGRIEAYTGDGIMKLSNNLNDNFNRLQLGGTTSAFPAIKRNGTAISIVLADDSGPASLNAGNKTLSSTGVYFGGTGSIQHPSDGVFRFTNAAETSFTRLELGTANLGISRGTGSPEGVVTALVGSLYIRTDGGASTTLYVKESSPTPSTGWVAK